MDGVRAFSEELGSFAADLRRLRLDRGNRSYRELTARAARSRTGIRLPVSTQSDAFRGDGLPRLDSLMGLVRILLSYDEFGRERPVPPHNSPELEPWRRRWRDLAALAPLRRPPAPAAAVTQEHAPVPARASDFALAHVLTTRADNNWCAVFSPDGRLLAVSGERDHEAVVQLWDPVRGVAVGELTDRPLAFSLAFSPGGHVLAVGDCEGTVTLWDTATFERLGPPLLGHDSSVDVVVFAADGRRLLTADDEMVHQWDTRTGEPAAPPLMGEIEAMFCRPDGSVLAALRTKHALRLWNLAAGASAGKPLIDGIDGPVEAVFSPGGALLATTYDGETLLWSTATGTVACRLPEAADSGATMAFSRDGRLLATMGDHGTVRLWDPSSGALLGPPLAEHKGPFDRLAMSPDGRVLALCGEADTLVVYRAEPDGEPSPPQPLAVRALDAALSSRQAVPLPPLASETGLALHRPAFSPDGSRLLVRAENRLVLTWDPAARVLLPEGLLCPAGPAPWGLDFPRAGGPAVPWTPRGTGAGRPRQPVSLVRQVAFCSGGGKVAVIGAEGRVSVLDTADGRAAGHVPSEVSDVSALAAAPEGCLLAAAMGERVLWWDACAPQAPRPEPASHVSAVGALAFSPDGRLLATGDADGCILLSRVHTPGAPAHRLCGHSGPVLDLAFSPRGHRLASAGADGTVRLWDTGTGGAATDLPLTGHTGAVRGVAFSPDASLLASAGQDGTLRCWLVPTARSR